MPSKNPRPAEQVEVSKKIEHLKEHIIKGYPDYPEFMKSIEHETPEVQTSKMNAKVEEFLKNQTPMSMRLF